MVKISGSPGPKATRVASVDTPVTQAPSAATVAPSRRPNATSSMAAAVSAGAKSPAQRKTEQQLSALPEGPTRQALMKALSSGLSPTDAGAIATALGGLSPAQQKDLSALLSKAGVSAKASPRTDADAERTFILKAVAGGASGATLKRLADQIRGRPPSHQGFSFNPLSVSAGATKRSAPTSAVDAAAAKLKTAMDDIWGTDEAAVFEALEGLDASQLKQVAEKYEKLTGTPLEDALHLELEGADLKRALTALQRQPPATASAPVQASTKAAATTKVAAASVSDIQKNLDAIQVTSKDEGTIQRGNAVELNDLIPRNVATLKPPKAKAYAPLKKAVEARNKAEAAVNAATTEPAKQAAQKKLQAAEETVKAEGEKVKEWLKKYIGDNPALRSATAAVKVSQRALDALEAKQKKAKVPKDPAEAEKFHQAQKTALDAAKAKLADAQAHQKTVKDGLLARVDAYAPMVGVKQTRSDVTVNGTTVRMRDGRETAYTNSWSAVDGGAVAGDSAAQVTSQLEKSGISEDRRKILESISGLEGTFSKVNTWDIGRVSWGFTQWTLGKNGNGTLAEFMRDLKKTDPAQYEKSFGKFGIDIGKEGVVLTRPDGTVLKGVAAAEAIRTDVKLAAVFMAAGADPAMQQAQIKFANEGKISGTRDRTVSVTGRDAEGQAKTAKLKLKDVVTSEYATAIMTDLAVNAGSGGKVAAAALEKYVKDKGVDPAKVKEWGPDAEKAIIAALEHASRSERLAHHAKAGFSKEPGSFTD
ncbi:MULTISPECIES: hypothetical protein [unclassified Corallococcus]|uniref:hypothetical protein n=1 Tax=unclassified Corallococcus TaxID=2685029 RepID=UPI001A8E6886|nr:MULTISPECIES: hypothetical protein [unclassified Corallococcus]MBN9686448.1 hypothetical protein [Corallococcus sp. NCSPR001]WAS82124.1 hypothetical protein O0N60_22665 [Corallococcus sp. NCRR]